MNICQTPSSMVFLEDQRGGRELQLDRQNSDAKLVKKRAESQAKKAEEKQATLEKRKRKSEEEVETMFKKGLLSM